MDMNNMTPDELKNTALSVFEDMKVKAQALFDTQDYDKVEGVLQNLENGASTLPLVGEPLSHVLTMVSLIRNYIRNQYKDVPLPIIVGMTAVLLYLVSPADIIPDTIPVVGLLDDVFLINFTWRYFEEEVEKYNAWRAGR